MTARILLLLLSVFLTACSVTGASSSGMTEPPEAAVIWPGADESVDAEPVLQWDAFPEAAEYQITVVDVDTGQVAFSATTDQPVMPVTPPLPDNVSYRWTVQALDENGEPFGEVSSFFRVKGALTGIWPANGESVDARPNLQWEPSPGAEQYHVIVVDDDAYPPVVAFDDTTTGTRIEVTPELSPGSYSWTVQGLATDGSILAELNSQFIVGD